MLLLRETHEVIGAKESLFEQTMRDDWMPALAKNDDARLLYYLNLAVGSGRSYQVISYTLFRNGNGLESQAEHVGNFALAGHARSIRDTVRHAPLHGAQRKGCHQAVQPPSTTRLWPVT